MRQKHERSRGVDRSSFIFIGFHLKLILFVPCEHERFQTHAHTDGLHFTLEPSQWTAPGHPEYWPWQRRRNEDDELRSARGRAQQRTGWEPLNQSMSRYCQSIRQLAAFGWWNELQFNHIRISWGLSEKKTTNCSLNSGSKTALQWNVPKRTRKKSPVTKKQNKSKTDIFRKLSYL